MRKMTWDHGLAAQAQNWANKCDFSHSPRSQRNGAGENLALLGGSPGNPGKDAAEFWACERSNIVGTGGLFPFIPSQISSRVKCQYTSGQTGHWTQVIWAESYKVIK